MPPFQYDTRPNPFVGSIGEMIARRGDIAARAALNEGQIWGGAVQQVGQQIGQPLQQMAQHLSDPRVQLEEEQLKAAKRDNRSRNVLEAELRNPANYTAEGQVDDAKLTARLKAQDVGAWQSWSTIARANEKNRLDLAKTAEEIKASQATTEEKQAALREKRRGYLGELAYHTEQAIGPAGASDPLHARDTFMAGVAQAAVDGGLDAGQARSVLQRTAGASPDQLREVLGSLIPPDLRAKFEATAATTAKTKADAAKAQAEADVIAKTGAMPGTPPASQAKTYRVTMPGGGTKDLPLEYLPGRSAQDPGRYFLNQPDGTRREMFPGRDFVDVPAASITIHNEKDAAAKTTRRELAEQVVDGNLPPSMLSRRAEDYNATLADAGKIYEERTGHKLNIGKLQLDYEAAKKFVATMNGSQMTRYRGLADSVVNTINEVQQLGDALQQSGVQKWNSVTRATIRQVYGNTPESELANRYVGAVNTLKEEFANLANGGFAPTDAAWKLANDQINGDFGFKDMRASLTEVQRLINYRTQAFGDLKPMQMGGDTSTPPGAGAGPVEGTVQPIPGHPGTEQTFRGGKWIRTK